ncbi:MAG: hypothetical protein IM591_13965 [Chitinophagaceae bacterium]|uniref:hypothetical protein n=1 Tax=Microcystis sp. M061S2 TaxID=2771171 RepID=UPI002585FC76|nr:hypothetical protein [Microcystis sp. M061S2]MCA2656610.1 hypothetical protein [Microcystis sp. M061S2]MCA6471483.1 hypothetical protein [Chitinophagaceae bacterium]
MAQQTAVEWLIKQLYTYELVDKNTHPNNLIFRKAKEMFQQQIIDAYIDAEGILSESDWKAGQYYNETYKKD